jgi:multisubunit Na+/H+ antiporter MnhF subunit
VSAFLIALAAIFIFLSVFREKRLENKLIAVDFFSSLIWVVLVWMAVSSKDDSLLDIILILSTVAFLGTLIFSRFFEKEGNH